MRKKFGAILCAMLAGGLAMTGGLGVSAREQLQPMIQSESQNPTLPEHQKTVSILLIGQDHKPEEPGARSDSMILCTICPENKSMTMTSILRDLYVEIPGHGKNRVNAAYAFGGAELLEKTLKQNLGIEVEGSVEVDFEHFSRLMDLLGGVPMELRQDEAREINRVVPDSDLHAGSAILSGDQALAYARIRKLDPDSDVSRSKRQRKVLEQIYGQYQAASARELVRVLREALPMINTNMKKSDIFKFAGVLLPIMNDLKVESRRIPAPGTYRDLTVNHMAVLDADLRANRDLVRELQSPAG